MNHVSLPARLSESAAAHGVGAYPYEACGLLIGYVTGEGVQVSRALRCPNVAPRELQTHRFSIDPRAVINVRRSLRGSRESVVGFYHSHPDAPAAPSATDMEFIRLWPETVWLIVPVNGGAAGEPRAWWLDDPELPAAREIAVRVQPTRDAALTCPE